MAVLGATLAVAQTKGVKVNLDDQPKAAVKPAAGKVDPNKPAVKGDAKKDEKKKDEMGKIEGIEIKRGDGYMGIELVNGTFKLSFYDAKKKPVTPDVIRANLTWKVRYQPNPEKTVLTSDGKAMTSAKVVKPPFAFSLSITLVKTEAPEAPVENFSVDFHT